MRLLATILVLGSTIFTSSLAAARTSGPACRSACAPRIAEQCGGLAGPALRRCRRPLLRACKATTPAIACETAEDLTRELADHEVQLADDGQTTITLCQNRQFLLIALPPNFDPNDPSVGDEAFGTWSVHIVGSGLGLVLADQQADAPRRLERNAAGTLLVDGVAAELADAATTCATTTFDPNDAERARLVALSAALADRTLVQTEDGSTEEEHFTLCSSGQSLHETFDNGTPAPGTQAIDGTWTVTAGGSDTLVLHEGSSGPTFGLEVRVDGTVLLDGTAVESRDARAACADIDLAARLTTAIAGKVFHFTQQSIVPLRTKLGLCDSKRFALDTTSSRHGTWRVAVTNGVAGLRLVDDNPVLSPIFDVAFDADGNVTVEGTTPVDDAAELARACEPQS
jgi:hypothetical protein